MSGQLPKMSINGITYIQMKVACPICIGNSKNVPPVFWKHRRAGCNSAAYIGSDARLYCPDCGSNPPLTVVKWFCKYHNNTDDNYGQQASSGDIAFVINMAGMLVSSGGHRWLGELMKNLK